MFKEIEKNLINNPKREILYYLGTKLTCEQLYMYVGGFAKRLKDLGVKTGDVITIAMPNIPQGVIALYATNKIGCICNMVHPKTPARKLLAIMKEANSKVAILVSDFYIKEKQQFDSVQNTYIFADIASFLPVAKRVLFRMKSKVKIADLKGYNFFGKEEKYHPKKLKTHKFQPDSPAVYLHSSGTLGVPKTVVLSNENINFVARGGIDLIPQGDITKKGMLAVLPLFHGFGLCMAVHTPIMHNMQCVLIPSFSPKAVVSAMKKTNVNVMCGVPKMYEKLLAFDEFISKDILKKLEIAFCGGEAVSQSLYEKFNAVAKIGGSKCMLFEGYGLTETSSVCTVNTFQNNKKSSCGKPIVGARVKIVDKNGCDLPRGSIGEIIISAPSVMLGYLNGARVEKREYIHSGDLGFVDEDGYLFFKQREKHVINIAGYNVYPMEIESVANEFQGVSNCAVLKCQDEKGEFAKLVVQPKKEAISDITNATATQDFKQRLKSHLGNYLESWCVPKEIVLVKEDMPQNMLGKIDLIKLQQMLDKQSIL